MIVFMNPFILFFVFTSLIFSSYSKPDIVLVGENHTDENDHKIQLDVIKDYYKQCNGKIIIAMEMFQQPFQKYLDMYIDEQINQEELLEKTEYKKRWGYDFSYYVEIIRFAREHKIRIFGINVPSELLREVKEKGIDNINSEYIPKEKIPYTQQEIDFILSAFKEHKISDYKKFMDIQYSWDAGMSYKIYKLKKEFPEHTIIVLVGKGHTHTIKRFLKVLSDDINVVVLN